MLLPWQRHFSSMAVPWHVTTFARLEQFVRLPGWGCWLPRWDFPVIPLLPGYPGRPPRLITHLTSSLQGVVVLLINSLC